MKGHKKGPKQDTKNPLSIPMSPRRPGRTRRSMNLGKQANQTYLLNLRSAVSHALGWSWPEACCSDWDDIANQSVCDDEEKIEGMDFQSRRIEEQ